MPKTSLAKAMHQAVALLGEACSYDPDLAKAEHAAMAHHALYAAAAARAGKMEPACQHKFMHMRHALEGARNRSYYDMDDSMRRNMDHYTNDAQGELNGPERGRSPISRDVDLERMPAEHAAVKHFKKGGGFVPHAQDKVFKEDYKGHKSGPKMGKK